MYYGNGSSNQGDSLPRSGELNFGWSYEGLMGDSETPTIFVDIYNYIMAAAVLPIAEITEDLLGEILNVN